MKMKKTHKLQFLILAVVYAAGMVMGCISFFLLPYYKGPQDMIDYAAEATRVFESTGALVQVRGYGLSYVAYDLDGNRRAINNAYGSKFVFELDVNKYLEQKKKPITWKIPSRRFWNWRSCRASNPSTGKRRSPPIRYFHGS